MNRQAPLSLGVRLLVAGAGALALAVLIAPHYVALWLSLYKPVIAWLLPDFRVVDISLKSQAADHVVSLTLETARPLWVGAKRLPAGVSVSSSTLQGHAVQHLVVVLSLLLVWPLGRHKRWTHRAVLLLFAAPALLIVEVLDIPFVLAGAITDLLLYQFSPSELEFSWLVRWMNLLNTGGRLALSLAAGLIAIGCYRLLLSHRADSVQT